MKDAPRLKDVRIVLLDKPGSEREYIRHVLESNGYYVLKGDPTCEYYKPYLQITIPKNLIIISDSLIPNLGKTTYEEITMQGGESIPVLLLVNRRSDNPDFYTQYPCDDILFKPFSAKQIVHKIEGLLHFPKRN